MADSKTKPIPKWVVHIVGLPLELLGAYFLVWRNQVPLGATLFISGMAVTWILIVIRAKNS